MIKKKKILIIIVIVIVFVYAMFLWFYVREESIRTRTNYLNEQDFINRHK